MNFPLSNQPSTSQGTSNFPIGLIVAGYGTACFAALILSLLGVGIIATGLTFWLGGAVGVLFWGGVWVYFRKLTHTRFMHPAEFQAAPQVAVSE
jgi:hypothetical protein